MSSLELAERDRLTQRILGRIHSNSILLRGAPGSGKKSLLLHLAERLVQDRHANTGCHPVLIDLHGVPESLLFATLGEALSQQLAPMPLLARTQAAQTLATRDARSAYSHRDFGRDLRSALRALKETEGVRPRLVLLVDGIDQIDSYSPRTAQRVRSLFMANLEGALVMVATAVEIDREWQEEGSPWYNFFEEIELHSPPEGPALPERPAPPE